MPPPLKLRNSIDDSNIPTASDRPPDSSYYKKNRESLTYAPHPKISKQRETAFIKYCRFARILEVRARGAKLTLPDIKTLCGDSVIWHSLQCLQLYGDDITLAQEAMEVINEALFCHSLFLNSDQAKRFSQHMSTHGFSLFSTLMTKIFIDAETRRRDSFVMNVTQNLQTLYYLINYMRLWNKTYEGSKILEKQFLRSVSKIIDQEDKNEWEELRFKNPVKLCPVCNKNSFLSGREGLLYCLDCEEFFSLVERFRIFRKTVTTLPVAVNWRDISSFEPTPTRMPPQMTSQRLRTRSLPRHVPPDWTIHKAKRFAREVCRKRRASRRLVLSISEDDAPPYKSARPTVSVSTETALPMSSTFANPAILPMFNESTSSASTSAELAPATASSFNEPLPATDKFAPSMVAKILAMFTPFEQTKAEQITIYNNLISRYNELNPTLFDIERKWSKAGKSNWEVYELGKYALYLRSKAKLLCLDVKGHESSAEISNAFAKIFNNATPAVCEWAVYAVQTGCIPEPAKNPWINDTSQNNYRRFIMPPEYKQAALNYMSMKNANVSVAHWLFSHESTV